MLILANSVTARVRETSTVIDDGCWKQVWAEITDSESEDRLFMYLWLSLHTPNSHAGRVAQLIAEANGAVKLGCRKEPA